MAKHICRYVLGMRRSSDIEGVFILDDEELAAVKEIQGHEVRYGEVSGKHSDVTCELFLSDIEILSSKEEEVAFFERIFPKGVGFSFPAYWFDTERAQEDGWDCSSNAGYKTLEEALVDYKQYNNSVMLDAFKEGFERGLEDKKNG